MSELSKKEFETLKAWYEKCLVPSDIYFIAANINNRNKSINIWLNDIEMSSMDIRKKFISNFGLDEYLDISHVETRTEYKVVTINLVKHNETLISLFKLRGWL